eukprot:6542743-Alexandrium_andersonii.AAC.1
MVNVRDQPGAKDTEEAKAVRMVTREANGINEKAAAAAVGLFTFLMQMGGACAASSDTEVKQDSARAVTIVIDGGWMVVTMTAVLAATWAMGFI